MSKLYVAFSGGADSTAMAILLHERGVEYELVFSDTGAELPETIYMVTRVAKVLGKPLNVVSNGTFYGHLASQGFLLPAPFIRWCTRLLKQVPQERFFANYPDAEVAIGIRADEAHRMGRKQGNKTMPIRPLVDAGMDKKDVLALCRKHDLLNPIYQWRSNTSCFCCFFQRISDWRGLLKHHPELYALAEQWEGMSKDWVDAHRAEGANPHSTWIGSGRTLKNLREVDENQLKLWPDPEEEPCQICKW